MRYAFIADQRNTYPIVHLCRVLDVSTSGFYQWLKRTISKRQQANQSLAEQIQTIHTTSRATYGSPRIHAELKAQGVACGVHRVARLMRQMGLKTHAKRRFHRTTRANPAHTVVENVLAQDFSATAPNQKWVADITVVETDEGNLYLAGVVDVFSRKVVGWSMNERMTAQLPSDAIGMALQNRPAPHLHHSDRGSQYTSATYLHQLEVHGILPSMSATGNCYDNAMMESFFATLKTECVRGRYSSRREARKDIFRYIEIWYNRHRRHSALGYLSPHAFEAGHS
jgi:putative transposase